MLLALLLSSMLGQRIAHRAHEAAGSSGAHLDCSAFVRHIYAGEGVELTGSVRDIHAQATRRHALRKRPRPGDLVFFRHTTGKDGFTHVGIVERVRGNEVYFVHRASRGVVRSRLDLRHPRSRKSNDFIRRASHGRGPKLAGECAAGFASPDLLRRS
ncbi:MAG TPA: NlpC/P60 family protein [Myxococcales bacterium]|nr:NlpC/P60 family protein [Myxococcales bacterium]